MDEVKDRPIAHLWTSTEAGDIRADGVWWRRLGEAPAAGRCDGLILRVEANMNGTLAWSPMASALMPVVDDARLVVVNDMPSGMASYVGTLEEAIAYVDEKIPPADWCPRFDNLVPSAQPVAITPEVTYEPPTLEGK